MAGNGVRLRLPREWMVEDTNWERGQGDGPTSLCLFMTPGDCPWTASLAFRRANTLGHFRYLQ